MTTPKSSRSTLAGIFVLALSIILFEIALTRVFAIMMWHHFTYMVVSVGLLGFGAAGSILTARRAGLRSDRPDGALTWLSLGYGLSVLFAFVFVTLTPIDSLRIWEWRNLVKFGLMLPAVAVPFLLGGLAVGLALTRYARDVDRLYFFDLVGSALGAGISVVLLARFGGAPTVVFASLFGLLAALLFSLGAGLTKKIVSVAGVAFGVWLTLVFTGVLRGEGGEKLEWPIPWAPNKEIGVFAQRPGATVHRIPSATAEVEVLDSRVEEPGMGGEFSERTMQAVPLRLVGQDGTAPTLLFEGAGHIEDFPWMRDAQPASAYRAFEARGGEDPEVLVIGVGGGVDVMVALAFDAARITAVEINTAMIRMVREDYADYIADLFTPGAHDYSDRIELVNSEGRSHLRHSGEHYDVIQMSGVDSFTALSSGAYSLSESYLYTTEAVDEFYEHLKPGGYINYSRFLYSFTNEQRASKSRETLRLANIAYVALAENGVPDPASQICVFRGDIWASIMIKRGPFTRAEIDALERFAFDKGFGGLVYDPLHEPGEPVDTALQAAQLQRHEIAAALSEHLPNASEERVQAIVDHVLHLFAGRMEDDDERMVAASAAAVAAAGPHARRVDDWLDGPFRARFPVPEMRWGQIVTTRDDFETVLRGDADERAAFIEGYLYDLTSNTDDKPFFFDYYRWSAFWQSLLGIERVDEDYGDQYHPTFPIGQLVLFLSMAQISLLGIVLILLPLWRLRRAGIETRGSWRYFCYFAALGMGFMFLEIPMMQKMMLFLGHPTYSLSVVLASILGFAGLGALVSGRFDVLKPANFRLLGIVVVATVVASTLVARYALPSLLGFALPVRIAIAVTMLAPMAFVLGMPFPTGIRLLEQRCPQLLPWGWAINGFLSVFSSIFCVALSMAIGFTAVFLLAALVYLLGFAAVHREVAAGRAAADGQIPAAA